MRRVIALAAFIVCAGMTPVFAQSAGWMVEFSGGAAAPTGAISSSLAAGGALNGGVGYQFAPWFALVGECGFAHLTMPPDVLQQLQAPDGHGRIITINAEPEFRFALPRRLNGFVEGGVGWIWRTVQLTEPTIQQIDYFDPFYGDIPQEIQTDQVLSSVTRNAWGGNVGGGVSLPIADTGADVFVDVRYYYAPTSPRTTAMVPVTFGVRWTAAEKHP